jgi:dipeptidyl aminopeptidase/acylaminoacyl peptidase
LSKSSAALVAFDFWGCGDTGGSYSDMSYERWTSNLEDVFAWVSEQEWADEKRIGFFGISSGTTPALRLAQVNHEAAFVISVATCLGLFIGMPNGPGRVLVDQWESLIKGETAEVFGVPFGVDFFKDFIGKAPVYNMDSITCPVFFLQGAEDNIWRRSDAWIGFQLLRKNGIPAKHLVIEGGDHGLDGKPERCAREVIHWLKEIHVIRI